MQICICYANQWLGFHDFEHLGERKEYNNEQGEKGHGEENMENRENEVVINKETDKKSK